MNQHPVGDDVSQRTPAAVGSVHFGMLAQARNHAPATHSEAAPKSGLRRDLASSRTPIFKRPSVPS